MKGVRFTKAELAWLREALDTHEDAADKVVKSIVAKLTAAEEAPKGVNVRPLEEALIKGAGGKVVALASPGGYARACKMATEKAATAEDMALIGAWLGRQGWMAGTKTLLDALSQYDAWLPKARAEAPPPGVPEGLNGGRQEGHVRQGSEAKRRPASGRRTPTL